MLGGETGRFYVLGGDRSFVDGVFHSAFLGLCWEETGRSVYVLGGDRSFTVYVLGADRSFVDGVCHSAFLGLCWEETGRL